MRRVSEATAVSMLTRLRCPSDRTVTHNYQQTLAPLGPARNGL